jgi:hypothetical protein
VIARPFLYFVAGLLGDVLIVAGGVHHRWPEVVVGLVIAVGMIVMLSTGLWLVWERTVYASDDRGRFVIDDPFERARETGYLWGPGGAGRDAPLSRAPYDQEVDDR